MIDVQLVKGTPLVFLDFCGNFFSWISTFIENQQNRLRLYQLQGNLQNELSLTVHRGPSFGPNGGGAQSSNPNQI